MLRGFVEQVLLGTQERLGAHDNLLADRVDRRVCHLGEELLEVVGQDLAAPAEHRQRNIRAHARDRLLAVLGHGKEDAEDIFLGVAECLLAGQQGVEIGRGNLGRLRQVTQVDLVLLEPESIGLGAADRLFELLVADDPPLREIHQEDLSRLEPAREPDRLGRDRQHADLAGQHNKVIVRDHVAAGTQAVAVEHRPDPDAITEDQAGRAIPGLQEPAVILVESAPRRIDGAVAFIGLGHEHHQAHGVDFDRPGPAEPST